MNSPTITCPEFLSMERFIIDDFISCTRESCEEIENCVKALNIQADPLTIHRLFRAMHSFKGNCQLVGLSEFVIPLNRIEEIVGKIRANHIPYVSAIGEFLLFATDEFETLISDLIETQECSNLRLQQLCRVSEHLLANATPFNVEDEFRKAIHLLDNRVRKNSTDPKAKKVLLEIPEDLELMASLSTHIDNLSIYRRNRSDQVAQLTRQLNEALGRPVDPLQLQAASLMHDIGMCFIPHNIFNKEGALSKEELRKIQEHVVISSQFLLRFGTWDDAARMVLDHHERFDGTGYPNNASGEEIHIGGRMLSIIDTFCSITTERSDRTFKKSLLSAISEINANSETQFDPAMVHVFNDVVRKMMMKSSS